MSITVRGINVTPALINGYAKRINSFDSIVTVWANAACIQAAQHGNRNWLTSLFALPMLRLANGELNKTGKQVLAYTSAHFPRVTWDSESQAVVLKKFNPNSPLVDHFAAPGIDVDALEDGHAFTIVKGHAYTQQADFLLTYAEFLNMPKAEKEVDDKPKSITAKAVASQMDKALTALKESRFAGTAEENSIALDKAKAFYLELMAVMGQAAAKVEADGQLQVDAEKAGQLLLSGQKGSAVRAGAKTGTKPAKAA